MGDAKAFRCPPQHVKESARSAWRSTKMKTTPTVTINGINIVAMYFARNEGCAKAQSKAPDESGEDETESVHPIKLRYAAVPPLTKVLSEPNAWM